MWCSAGNTGNVAADMVDVAAGVGCVVVFADDAPQEGVPFAVLCGGRGEVLRYLQVRFDKWMCGLR